MLYLAIPAHNEAATIGVLLWRLRTVLAEFPREYEAVVYDDASSDSTSEILESYAKVMPLTVLRGERQVGYAGAVDALVRHVARDTRYPRRDAMLLLQGDFTDSPSLVPEFVKRFEGGTDIVVGERGRNVRRKAPAPVKRLLQFEPWLTRFLVRAEGIRDLTSSYRLVRISVLRDLLRSVGDSPVCAGDARTANADFLMRIVPLARRVEALPIEPTWEVRLRETRVVAVPDAMNILRWAWRSRGRKAVPSTAPETSDAPKHSRNTRESRPDLRLETASDWSGDASVVTTSSRSGASQRDSAGARGRKGRGARGDAKSEVREPRTDSKSAQRSEGRSESRSDGRAQTRAGVRPETGSEGRRESRNETRPDAASEGRVEAARTESPTQSRSDSRVTARAEAAPVDLNEAGLVSEIESSNSEAVAQPDQQSGTAPRERPARRRRSRGGRRDRAGNGADGELDPSVDGESAASSGEPQTASHSRSDSVRPSVDADADADDSDSGPEFGGDRELSPSLSDAVSDVELALDGGGRPRPPRKKRRRRGSRGGRAGAATDAAEDTADGSAEPLDSPGDRSDFEGRDTSDFADGEAASDAGDSENSGDPEARVRRRGRRGRRGGSRRGRAARGEGENSSGGEDFSAPPPPASASED